MKKLLLIRHAKAVSEIDTNDYERPLKYTGLQDAEFMAERVKTEMIVPQILISSAALRTETTANIFSEHLMLPKPILDKNIYSAGKKALVNIINQFPDDYNFIGLVGHNPDISELITYFTEEERNVPTCTVALIEFMVDSWKLLSESTGNLTWYSTPKEY
jgi:phosphohistidine phosphatase